MHKIFLETSTEDPHETVFRSAFRMPTSRSYPRHFVKKKEKEKSILPPFLEQGFPRVTKGYQGLPKVTKGYQRLPKVTKGYQRL